MDKVIVKSVVDFPLGVCFPDLRFKREWTKKGQKIAIPKEIMEEAVYDNGFMNMIKIGYLVIEEKEDRVSLGIQEEDEPDPIILSDGQIERLLTTAPFVEFKQTCSQLPPGQIKQIAQYAINNGVGSLDRCGYIKEITGIDIMKSIEVKRQIEEE